eukprot:11121461-Ditylum_brightwellii.AAC.2
MPIFSTAFNTPAVPNIWSIVLLPCMYIKGVFLLYLAVIKLYSSAFTKKDPKSLSSMVPFISP